MVLCADGRNTAAALYTFLSTVLGALRSFLKPPHVLRRNSTWHDKRYQHRNIAELTNYDITSPFHRSQEPPTCRRLLELLVEYQAEHNYKIRRYHTIIVHEAREMATNPSGSTRCAEEATAFKSRNGAAQNRREGAYPPPPRALPDHARFAS